MNPETLTTLRYWNAGPFSAQFGDDAEGHDEAAYNGLVVCLDLGLLNHVPNFSQYADGYRPSMAGLQILAELGDGC